MKYKREKQKREKKTKEREKEKEREGEKILIPVTLTKDRFVVLMRHILQLKYPFSTLEKIFTPNSSCCSVKRNSIKAAF
jgi:hypothetical protein